MIIIPANTLSTSTGGFDVANSCRFNSDSNDHLNRTQTAGNRRKFTFSTWVKRCNPAIRTALFLANRDGFNYDQFFLHEDGFLEADFYHSGTQIFRYKTDALYRDPSSWYHMIMAVDTEHDTASSRVRIYVNGLEVTSFSTETNPSENVDTHVNENSIVAYIGSDYRNFNESDVYLAETVMLDGTQATPTDFGEFDSDSGIWKPIDVSGLTFGTNGFYLDFENSGALGADVSGNSNNFTVNNLTAIDQSTDTCTNNFATINPLNVDPALSYTFAQGNLDVTIANSGGEGMTSSTFAVSNGKWYWECKLVSSSAHGRFGVVPTSIGATKNPGEFGIAWQMNDATMQLVNSSVSGSWGSNPSDNDILMFALDCDNQAFYFGVNGTWRNSGDPTSGSSRTGGVNYSGQSTLTSDDLTVGFGGNFFSGGGSQQGQYNFGGTQSFTISSGNTDGNDRGNFEYAVPSGYYSLNTKNLAEYG